eukprot:52080-Eustigmatos_ZCMA.PRE.1
MALNDGFVLVGVHSQFKTHRRPDDRGPIPHTVHRKPGYSSCLGTMSETHNLCWVQIYDDRRDGPDARCLRAYRS